MIKRSTAVAAAALFALQPVTAVANPWSIIGFDSASIGKGNALTGGAKGAAATYYNPAGLIKEKKRDITFSYIYGKPLLKYDRQTNEDFLDLGDFEPYDINAECGGDEACITDVERYNQYVNGVNGNENPTSGDPTQGLRASFEDLYSDIKDSAENTRQLHGATIGMALPLALNPEDAFAAAGVGIFVPIGPVVYQRIKGPTTPFFLDYDDAPHRIVVDVAGAVEIIEGLRVGVGVDILVNVDAAVDARILLPPELSIVGEGSILSPEPNLQDIMVYAEGTVKLPITITPTAGIQYSPTEWIDIGARFRNEQDVSIKAGVDLMLDTPFGSNRIPAELLVGSLFTPRQVAGGFAFYPLDGLSIFADVTWKQWENYRPPFAIDASVGAEGLNEGVCDLIRTFQDLDEQVGDLVEDIGVPITLDQEGICSLVSDALPEEIEISLWDRNNPQNRLKNIISPALGLSYQHDKLLASAGYQFDPSPVPEQTGIFNILDADTHMISGYFQYQILSFVTAGAHFQYQKLKSTTTQKSQARVLDQTNESDGFPDAEFTYNDTDGRLNELENAVQDTQTLSPGYPGYTVGGGFLTVGVQFNLIF